MRQLKNYSSCLITMFLMLASANGFAFEEDFEQSLEMPRGIEWHLDLYYRVGCPYSQKVIRYLNKTGIAIPMKDVQRDAEALSELMHLTGKTQVPCLVINGEPLLESDQIINWLGTNIYRPLPE